MTLNLPCRFTDRYLAVKPHGSGVKLTIDPPRVSAEERRSVFLDASHLVVLARELTTLAGEDTWPPLEPRQPALEATEVALFDLERAIKAARQKIAEALA